MLGVERSSVFYELSIAENPDLLAQTEEFLNR
jgi:hypothetical protein